jgi:hypothetical protein
MKSKIAPRPDFDPYLGLGVAQTWWDLGRLLAIRDDPDKLKKWADSVRARADLGKAEVDAITLKGLTEFASTVYDLLKAKFGSERIGPTVRELVRGCAGFDFVDSGQYMRADEHGETFWANEYRLLFDAISKPDAGEGWITATGTCLDCGVFFVKGRRDQQYHNTLCRMRVANRRAYARISGSRRGRLRRGRLKGKR